MSLDLDAIRERATTYYVSVSPWHALEDARALLAEVERLRANQADLRRIVAAQDAEIQRLTASTLPITCMLCGVPVQGVRCPDGCQPKIVTGEEM